MSNSRPSDAGRWRPARRAIIGFALIVGQVSGLVLLMEQQARAYVDPGSGLLLLQMLGASIAGVFYALRHKLARRFGRSRSVAPPGKQPAAPAEESNRETASRPQT